MKACITIIGMMLMTIICNAQIVNKAYRSDSDWIRNKNIYNFKSKEIEIFWIVTHQSENSIRTKNYIQNSNNYFECSIIDLKSDSCNVIIVEHSPKNTEFKKIINYSFDKTKLKLNFKTQRQTVMPGLSYPTDFNWTKELEYNKKLDDDIFTGLVLEILKSNK